MENRLYANIHHDTGCEENQLPMAHNDNPSSDFNTSNEADRRNKRSAKRYWSAHTSGPTTFVPYYKEKQSGIYKRSKAITGESGAITPGSVRNDKNNASATIRSTTTSTPKQFTPYVSFLTLNDSSPDVLEQQTPMASTSQNDSNSHVLKTTNDLIRKNLTTKNINPFSKEHTIDQYKRLYGHDESIRSENKKRLNPFNPLSRKAKKKKSELNEFHKSVRKNREELKQGPAATSASVIVVDEPERDDDDVIILPTQKPPLICIDSSDDDETTTTNATEHEFTEPTAICDNRRKMPRSSSPSSSIQSADDFIGQNDRRTFGFNSFGTLSDEDLCHVGETVENEIRNKSTTPVSSKRAAISNDNDNAIFTPPKLKEKTKPNAKKTYEVAANSFTAVDVYESESSDMPDSVYGKGVSNKRKKITDSDSSSVESITVAKSKRLRKRKSSSCARESDHMHSDESSSDLPEEDDDNDHNDEDQEPSEISYLVRGEALGKVKNPNKKSANTNKKISEKRPEDDFMNKLSNIVRGEDESDDPESLRTSMESIEARDIVETVLQRRTRRLKKNQTVENEPNQLDNEKLNAWEITDQIGETDDLNLRRIFNQSALDSINDDENSPNNNKTLNSSMPQATKPSSKQPILQQTMQKDATNETSQNPSNAIIANESDDMFDPEIGWNDEMKRFYNESWGGETFSLRNIRARMPSK